MVKMVYILVNCWYTGCQSATGAERVPVSPAVLLSPPQQRDHFQHVPGNFLTSKIII